MGTPRNIATLPVSIDTDAFLEAMRPELMAMAKECLKELLEQQQGAPEIMKPCKAAKFMDISVATLRRKYGHLKIVKGGLPYYKRDDLVKI